jgi:hypothetical protein
MFVKAHPDYESYHLLWAIRECDKQLFQSVPEETKAAILASALEKQRFVNDWGRPGPGEGFDYFSALALMETGPRAIRYLLPLLDNRTEAPRWGSADATISSMYKYRRCDYAYRYVCLIQNRPALFAIDPVDRDGNIASLKLAVPANSAIRAGPENRPGSVSETQPAEQ